MNRHHQSLKKFACDICSKLFRTSRLLGRHLKRHGNRAQNDPEKLPDQYDKFIAENFDMSCDLCDTVFVSFKHARCHYKQSHGEPMGYIKCCKSKLRKMSFVKDHIDSHLKPDSVM